MNSKKSLIFWICFYTLEFTGALLLILLQRESWIFNGFSAFPLAYLIVCVFLAWYLPTIWNFRRSEDASIRWRLWHTSTDFDERQARMYGMAAERSGTWKDPMWSFMSRICLALVPMFLLFVFFCSVELKIASFAFGMLIYCAMMLFWYFLLEESNKEEKALRKQRRNELEEQKKREELGKWK